MEFSDLTPEALDRLEAKLAAELDTVRKVKALLQEHFRPRADGPASVALPAAAAPVVPVAAPVAGAAPTSGQDWMMAPQVQRKELKVRVLEWALERGKAFRIGDLVEAMQRYESRSTLRSALVRLQADGDIVIVTKGWGRTGSIYQARASLQAHAEVLQEAPPEMAQPTPTPPQSVPVG